MKILITNDDGIHSPGLNFLANSFQTLGEVTIVAPDTERSAVGHSITISHPLRVQEVRKDNKIFGYAINGTPADCVKIALGAIMKERADLVVSGINLGLNIGTNIIYSGTVSGAMEGAILGLPALAVSIDVDKYTQNHLFYEDLFSFPSEFSVFLAKLVMENGLPERTLLNINFPSCSKEEIKGIAITKQGQTIFRDRFQKRLDPRQNVYYWLEGDEENMELEGGDKLDYTAVKKGFISITPLFSDLTNHGCIEKLKEWAISLSL
jgi:5'-nucleotidase